MLSVFKVINSTLKRCPYFILQDENAFNSPSNLHDVDYTGSKRWEHEEHHFDSTRDMRNNNHDDNTENRNNVNLSKGQYLFLIKI